MPKSKHTRKGVVRKHVLRTRWSRTSGGRSRTFNSGRQ